MIERRILVKDIYTNYKIFGSGKPFLILHGWGSKSDKWQGVGELLSKNKITAIIPDLPGFGKSQEPQNAWSIDNYIEWLFEFSEKLPELKKGFYLLGHSFGGSLAVKFTIKYNQKVEKLFLISASCLRKLTLKKRVSYKISKVVKLFSFLPYYNLLRKVFYKFIFKSDYPYVEGVMKDTYLKVILDDLSPKLSFVKVPTVIIWGDKDVLTPVKDAYFINKKIENSKLVVIPGADHSLNIKIPEILAEKIAYEI